MNRSERNDYRTDSDYRGQGPQSQWQGSQRPPARQGTYNSDATSSYGVGSNYGSAGGSNFEVGSYEANRFDSPRTNSFGNNWQNNRSAGMHTGKGPKGYRRSDDRIKEDVSEALQAHPEIDASEIEIDVKDSMVTLSGTVESRQIKRLAEDCVERLSGVTDVKNDLRIMASIDNYGKSKSASSDFLADPESQTRTGSKSNLAGRQSPSTSTASNKSVQ